MSTATKSVTELITAARDEDREAANELFTLVYQELHQMAQHYLRQERPNHTLQATALVHEVYLRLFNGQKIEMSNRAHFFGIVAKQMRRILVFSRHYPRAARIVELRYFGGLTEAEAAEAMDISLSTLKREWGFAKTWLLRQLSSTPASRNFT